MQKSKFLGLFLIIILLLFNEPFSTYVHASEMNNEDYEASIANDNMANDSVEYTISNLLLTEDGEELSANDIIHFSADIESNYEITHVTVMFSTISKNLSFYLSEDKTDKFSGHLILDKSVPSGEYRLSSITLYFDVDGISTSRTTYYSSDTAKPIFSFNNIYEPNVQVIEMACQENEETLYVGDVIHFSVKLEANYDITYVWSHFTMPSSGISVALNYNSETGFYECEKTIDKSIAEGKYSFSFLEVYMDVENTSASRSIYSEELDSSPSFYISNNSEPSFSIEDMVLVEDGETLNVGDTLHFSVKINANYEITHAYAMFDILSNNLLIELQYNNETDRYEAEKVLDKSIPGGNYSFFDICIYMDVEGVSESKSIYRTELDSLPGFNFLINEDIEDVTWQLQAPTNPSWSGENNTVASWDGGSLAKDYTVSIEIKEKFSRYVTQITTDTTSLDLQDKIDELINHAEDVQKITSVRFKVRANSGDIYTYKTSEWSEYSSDSGYRPSSETIALDSPSNPAWSGDNRTIASWSAVENAASYYVEIAISTGNSKQHASRITRDTAINLKDTIDELINGIPNTPSVLGVQFRVKAQSGDIKKYKTGEWSDYSSDSGYRGYAEAIPIDTPSDLRWTGNNLTVARWNPADNAGHYLIEIAVRRRNATSTTTATTTTNTINLKSHLDKLFDGIPRNETILAVVFRVKAESGDIKHYKSSDWSEYSWDSGYRMSPVDKAAEEDFFAVFDSPASSPYAGITYNSSNQRYEIAYSGAAIKPAVDVSGTNGSLIEGTDYTVKYANNTAISAKGKTATVTVTGKGNYSGTKVLEFYIIPVDLEIAKEKGLLKVPSEFKVQSGKKVSPVITYRDYTLKAADYTISNPYALKTDTRIDISGKGNFTGSLQNIDVKAVSASDAKSYTIKVALKAKTHIYNGNEQVLTYSSPSSATGELTVTAGSSKTPLTEGADYKVEYMSNTSAGTARVIVNGIGNYMGTVTKTFVIQPDKTSPISADLADSEKSVVFDPTGAKPAIAVTKSGIILKEGNDYNVSYSNNMKIGTGKYTVTFLGNYKGHKSIANKTFSITAAPFSRAIAKSADLIYSKSAKCISSPYVSIDGVLLSEKDYTVKYLDGNSVLTPHSKVILDNDTHSKKITVEVTGRGNYQSQTISTSYYLREADSAVANLSMTKIVAKAKNSSDKDVSIGQQEYTGKAIRPEIRVIIKAGTGWTEVPSSAYDVYYYNNVNKGRATILIIGDGINAIGCQKVNFTIGTRSMGLLSLF